VKAFDARQPPDRVFLTARGAIAYAGRGFPTYIYVADARGHRRVASGENSDLPLGSVRTDGNQLKWRFRGSEQSLRLR
jgi:hypothetical protein